MPVHKSEKCTELLRFEVHEKCTKVFLGEVHKSEVYQV